MDKRTMTWKLVYISGLHRYFDSRAEVISKMENQMQESRMTNDMETGFMQRLEWGWSGIEQDDRIKWTVPWKMNGNWID